MWHQMSKGKNKVWVNPQTLMLVKAWDDPARAVRTFDKLKDMKAFLLSLHEQGYTHKHKGSVENDYSYTKKREPLYTVP